ncbi:MAG TPA: stage II sporulation protein M [Gemmataceae bacterium]|nr:stage II sporulation protein M [Gemmataceae bacterium]
MDLITFIQQRRPEWRRLEEMLRRVEGSGLAALDDEEAVEFGQRYRRAASDLNQAQTFVTGDATVRYLNDLVARCYLVIHGRPRTRPWRLVRYLLWGYPAVFRRYLRQVLLAAAIFTAGAVLGFLASYLEPDVARLYLLPTDMPMIQPPREGEPDPTPPLTSGELAAFSSHLFTNNVSVSLVALALGITLGIGTAWLLFSNGILLGALGAVFVEAGQPTAFATGILPHGVLEIPAILIAGGAGFVLAGGLIWARPWPRLEELARCGKEALLLAAGCFPLLSVAALLEAGVARAPDWFLGSGLKLAVAGIFGLLFVAYVLLLGWGKADAGS